jgi:hypothetical protein
MLTNTIEWLKFTARLTASLHCGSYLYMYAVQHPSILALKSPRDAVQRFNQIFKPTTRLQIPMKLVSIGSCLLASYLSKHYEKNYLYAAIILATLTPYSHILMSPFSDPVLDEGRGCATDETKVNLIKKWVRLHTGRLVISLVANYFLQMFD